MSKDVLASRVDPDDELDVGGRRRPVVAALLALTLLVTGLLVVRPWGGGATPDGRAAPGPSTGPTGTPGQDDVGTSTPLPEREIPVGEGLFSRFEARDDPAEVAIDRVRGTLVLANTMPLPRTVLGVEVAGLGTTFVGVPADVVVPPGGQVRLPVTVIADCRLVRSSPLRILVEQRYGGGDVEVQAAAPADRDGPADALVEPVCPRPEPGVLVVATTARTRGDGTLLLRLVNTGAFTVQVSLAGVDPDVIGLAGDVPLPLTLDPGRSQVLRLSVVVGPCDAARQAEPYLQAGFRDGFTRLVGPDGRKTGLADEVLAAVNLQVGRECA